MTDTHLTEPTNTTDERPPAIVLDDVWVQYRLRHAHHYNLKRSVSNLLTRRKDETEIITALQGVSLTVPKGARVGLTGPNGAGKSTLLAVLSGALAPTLGAVKTQGRILALLGGPNDGLDPEQTGRENALNLGVRRGETSEQMRCRLAEIQEFSGLAERFDHPVYSYSSGMQIRLRFSTLTTLKADILLMDEAFGMADADFSNRANVRLGNFLSSSGTLILATHSERLIKQHCNEVISLASGSIKHHPVGYCPPSPQSP